MSLTGHRKRRVAFKACFHALIIPVLIPFGCAVLAASGKADAQSGGGDSPAPR
jgi:hypothetical protein